MKQIVALAILAMAAIGCHSQLPPTHSYNVIWTWGAPSAGQGWPGCSTGSPCTYVVSIIALPAGTSGCPPPTGTNYVAQQTATTGVSGTTYTQTNATGLTECGVIQAIWQGSTSAWSAPSDNGVPRAVPSLPLAPGTPSTNAQQAVNDSYPRMDNPAPKGELAKLSLPMRMTSRVVWK